MKRTLSLGPVFLLTACSTTSMVDNNQPVERCESTDCFNQLQIRDFEVVDETSMIVYVGGQECPFLVELTGTFCDLTFLPGFDVVFTPTDRRRMREPTLSGGSGSSGRADIVNARVCSNDLDMGIAEGPFSSAGGSDQNSIDGLSCRIRNVRSLTDDEILEIYVENQIAAPPPPFGTGQIAVPEQAEEGEEASGDSAAGSTQETGASGSEPTAANGN